MRKRYWPFLLLLAAQLVRSEQSLFVSDLGSRSLIRVSLAGATTPFATLSGFPEGSAFDTQGNLFVSWGGDGNGYGVDRISPSGGQVTVITFSGQEPFGMVCDDQGRLFGALGGQIISINLNGTYSTFADPGMGSLAGLTRDAAGNLYACGYGADVNQGFVVKVAPDATWTTFVTGLNNPKGLAFDGAGNLYAANADSHNIWKILHDGTHSIFASDLNGPWGIACDAQDNVYAVTIGDNTVHKFAPDGTPTILATGFSGPTWLSASAVPEPSCGALLLMSVALYHAGRGARRRG